VGNLFKGVYFIHRFWDVRGRDTANNVERNAWVRFHCGLTIARDALLRAAVQDTNDPTPYSYLAGAVVKGLQVDKKRGQIGSLRTVVFSVQEMERQPLFNVLFCT